MPILNIISDISVYLCFTLIMCCLAWLSHKKNPNSTKIDIFLWGYIFFFTIISAIRWKVGSDCDSYVYNFVTGTTARWRRAHYDREWISLLITFLPTYLHLPHWVGMGIMAFLQILFITLALKTDKKNLLFFPIILFGGYYYLMLMNVVRQMLVGCIFLWATRFIVNKQPWHYAGFILLSALIHHSALLLIPLYFIPSAIQLLDKRKLILLVYTLCIVVGIFIPKMEWLAIPIEWFGNMLGYSTYTTDICNILRGQPSDMERMSYGPTQISYMLVGYIIIWFSPLIKKMQSTNSLIEIWYGLAVLFGCLHFLLCNINMAAPRVATTFLIFPMVLASILLRLLTEKCYKSHRYKAITILYLLIVWIGVAWNIVKDYTRYEAIHDTRARYQVFFSHKEEIEKIRQDYKMTSTQDDQSTN